MRRWGLAGLGLLLLAGTACGKYGPPERAPRPRPPQAAPAPASEPAPTPTPPPPADFDDGGVP